jgi:hypothetical protein
MAWPGKSQILSYWVLNQLTQGTGAMVIPPHATPDTFNIALYGTGSAVSNTGTTLVSTEYGATNPGWLGTGTEVANSGTYAAGGSALTSPSSAQSTQYWTFTCATAPSWTSATITAYGALIYDNTVAGKPGICYLDFLGVQTVTAGTFTVTFQTANSVANAIAQITLT